VARAAPVMPATATEAGEIGSQSPPRGSSAGGQAHRITTLDSGVRVVTERIPEVRSVALGFLIATGSVIETPEQAGISHLLEHMLFRGTESYRSEQIDQIFDEMGAEINAGTEKEATSLYTRVLDGHLERAFDVMADMIWRPRFEQLDAEKEVVLEEIAMYEDDPQDRAFEEMDRAVFAEHPLGRPVIGTARAVGEVTLPALQAFHSERYTHGEIVIAAAGSVDHDTLVGMAERSQAVPHGVPATVTPELPPVAFAPRVRFLEKETEQYHLCIGGAGMARDDERRFALRVLEGILGGTSSSRLFQEVREKRGLAYSVFSYSNLYARAGEIGVYVGTRPENLVEAVRVVTEELRRCVEDPATEQELTRSRENLKGRMVLGLESTGARMGRLGAAVLGGLPIFSVDEVIERIDAVSMDDLRALAAELYGPEQLSVAAVGPGEGRFLEAIEPLGVDVQAEAQEAAR
jgi:predicted Zn-dependent peptidase